MINNLLYRDPQRGFSVMPEATSSNLGKTDVYGMFEKNYFLEEIFVSHDFKELCLMNLYEPE